MCVVRVHACNSPWPTFMMIFMDLVLQTPPTLFSNPSCVPLEVAERERERERKRGAWLLSWRISLDL